MREGEAGCSHLSGEIRRHLTIFGAPRKNKSVRGFLEILFASLFHTTKPIHANGRENMSVLRKLNTKQKQDSKRTNYDNEWRLNNALEKLF